MDEKIDATDKAQTESLPNAEQVQHHILFGSLVSRGFALGSDIALAVAGIPKAKFCSVGGGKRAGA